jgi:pimeloyl-ACP methyl ester carboxylesterase
MQLFSLTTYILLSISSFILLLPIIHAETCIERTAYVRLNGFSLFATDRIVGTLCYEGSLNQDKRLLLTVHGVTYNRNYFDFGYNNRQYSFVKYAVQQGYMVFNIDRIGAGASSHPIGALVDLDAAAYTIYQVIMQLRSGYLISGHRFSNVVFVGHSYGSFVGVRLAALYQNVVDGLVLTGYLHNVNPDVLTSNILALPDRFGLAETDPKFGLLFPIGYLTVTQNGRAALFFNPGHAEAGVIAEDYVERDVMSIDAIPDIIAAVLVPESLLIAKPVLIIVGDKDELFCGGLVDCTDLPSVISSEHARFSANSQLQVNVIQNSGHDLNLHDSYMQTFGIIKDWLAAH